MERKMLDDNVTQNLRKLLEQKMEILLADREALEKLKAQIAESEEQVYAIKKVLGDDDAQIYFNKSRNKLPVLPKETKEGTVTHSIRLILEENPEVTPEDGIQLVKEECLRQGRSTNIDKNSWSQWNTYFRTGKYRMDTNAYRRRYKQEPPY